MTYDTAPMPDDAAIDFDSLLLEIQTNRASHHASHDQLPRFDSEMLQIACSTLDIKALSPQRYEELLAIAQRVRGDFRDANWASAFVHAFETSVLHVKSDTYCYTAAVLNSDGSPLIMRTHHVRDVMLAVPNTILRSIRESSVAPNGCFEIVHLESVHGTERAELTFSRFVPNSEPDYSRPFLAYKFHYGGNPSPALDGYPDRVDFATCASQQR